MSKGNTKHGESRTPLHCVWVQMRKRCRNRNYHGWLHYGGRGIKICARWNNYEAFRDDMAPHPGKGWTLDRIDNNGDYEPSNCRWATRKDQQRNQRRTKLTMLQAEEIRRRAANGESGAALGREFGVHQVTASHVITKRTWA